MVVTGSLQVRNMQDSARERSDVRNLQGYSLLNIFGSEGYVFGSETMHISESEDLRLRRRGSLGLRIYGSDDVDHWLWRSLFLKAWIIGSGDLCSDAMDHRVRRSVPDSMDHWI